MARRTSTQNQTAQRALIALAATGAALGAGAATASAAEAGPAVDAIRMNPTTSLGKIDPQSAWRRSPARSATSRVRSRVSSPTPSPVRASTRSTTAWAPSSPTSSRLLRRW